MLYERPVRLLLVDCLEAIGPTFTPSEAVAWFNAHYPLVDDKTVRAHVRAFCVNDPNRKHYTFSRSREGFLFKTGRSTVTKYDREMHGDFGLDGFPLDEGTEFNSGGLGDASDVDELLDAESALTSRDAEFALEVYLEEFLLTNWMHIPWGAPLKLFGNGAGHQFVTPVGRLDFLAVDTQDDALVVIELKRGRPADQVVGQALRYMGWITHNLAAGRPVRGLIIAAQIDDRLKYAASIVPDLQLMSYAIQFDLRPEALTI